MSEIRHGCDVYPYVVEKAQPLDVSRWQLSPWAKRMAAKPATDEHIADAVAAVVRLSHDELAAFARQLVAADAQRADRLIDALIGAFEMQPQRQRATELAAVVEVERRRTFVLELQKAINAVIDGVLRRTQ